MLKACHTSRHWIVGLGLKKYFLRFQVQKAFLLLLSSFERENNGSHGAPMANVGVVTKFDRLSIKDKCGQFSTHAIVNALNLGTTVS